jgi:hypothetical protein
LRLSESELAAALTGLSPVERIELLSLLEAREALEAEQPTDERPPLEHYLDQARQAAAAKSDDPAAWHVANEAHAESRSVHYRRLMDERGQMTEDINAYMAASIAAWHEADDLAIADGFPDPDSAVKCAAPDVDADPDDRPPLPRATAEDVLFTPPRCLRWAVTNHLGRSSYVFRFG